MQATLAEVQSAWQATSRALEAKGAAEAQQVTAALQQLREDLAAQLPAGKLRGIEGKLAALEGSVLSAGGVAHHFYAPCAGESHHTHVLLFMPAAPCLTYGCLFVTVMICMHGFVVHLWTRLSVSTGGIYVGCPGILTS